MGRVEGLCPCCPELSDLQENRVELTRTDAIMAAIKNELQHHPYLDSLTTLRSLRLDLKLVPGTLEVRAVLVYPESERILTSRKPP